MKPYTLTAVRNILIFCACACFMTATTTAQTAGGAGTADGAQAPQVAKASYADGVSLMNSI